MKKVALIWRTFILISKTLQLDLLRRVANSMWKWSNSDANTARLNAGHLYKNEVKKVKKAHVFTRTGDGILLRDKSLQKSAEKRESDLQDSNLHLIRRKGISDGANLLGESVNELWKSDRSWLNMCEKLSIGGQCETAQKVSSDGETRRGACVDRVL